MPVKPLVRLDEQTDTAALPGRYPAVNYIGNKEKMSDFICDAMPGDVQTVFDAFSGGSSVAYRLKQRGKRVITNDVMAINQTLAQALIENDHELLTADDLALLFAGKPRTGYVYEHYRDQLFYAEECQELDQYRANIAKLANPSKQALALSLVRRAAIRKMPYSRFNIAWNKVQQLRDEDYSYRLYGRRRAYHNQSFRSHIEANVAAYNRAIFSNGQRHQALNLDIFDAISQVEADLIYLDPPYAGTMNNYYAFYNFLDEYVAGQQRAPLAHSFTDKKTVVALFDRLFASLGHFRYWLLSYNSNSYPDKATMLALLQKHARSVKVIERKHVYQITGKANKGKTTEYLFIAER